MDNHLIIGLGGTGGKIIRALRKAIYQAFRTLEPHTATMRFLYVDSSKEMMRLDDPSWRILGRSVQLDNRSQLLITGSDLRQILANLGAFPQIRPWIGDRAQWRDILNSYVGESLGWQKRRLGRFLFACKARHFTAQLQALAGDMQTSKTSAITFHICCGLAGGTGSGSVIDVLCQVRHMFRDSRTYRIILYALLPEDFPHPGWDTGNYHANAYAALLELNALSVGAFQPHNVAENGNRLHLPDPFNGCYLFTNQNVNGLQLDVTELPNVMADFLFQKIAAATSMNSSVLARMEDAENGDATPESRPGTAIGERSKRFLTFGIKRLMIPEQEIREYLTFKFARQAALQLRFNNWSESLGYLDVPHNQDLRDFERQEMQERWLISDDHLCLSRGISAEEANNKEWKTIQQEWTATIPELVLSLVREREMRYWLKDLEELCAQRFDDNYRGIGVRKFYDTKLAARQEHVRTIRRRIETGIFKDWENGVRSMHDLSRLVNALLGALDERLKAADHRITKARENEEYAANKVAANRAEWTKVGLLSQWLGKRHSLLGAHAEWLRDLYIYRTQVEAWSFAKRLLQDLIPEITRLGIDLQNCAALIDDGIKEFNDRIAQRCNHEIPDLRQSVVRFYKPEKVKQFARDLEKDQTEQSRQAQRVRRALIQQLGEDPGFAAFQGRLTRRHFLDTLEQQCETNAKAAHDNLIATHKERSPLFGVNIVDALEQEFYKNEERLRSFVRDLVTMTGNYLDFNTSEVNRVALGIPPEIRTRISRFMIIIPKAQEHIAFAEKLKALFRQQLGGDIPIEITEDKERPNEITLIGLTNLFPLRYIKPLTLLKERYDNRVRQADKPAKVKLELHCEGDGSQYPKLFISSQVLDIAKDFFTQADATIVESVLGHTLVLRPNDDLPFNLVALWQEGQVDPRLSIADARQKYQSKLRRGSKLYLVYKDRGPDSATLQALRAHTGYEVIPIFSTLMEQALWTGDSERVLHELEEPYLVRSDPYAESKPIADPQWFYGREKLLQRLPRVLAQGQHVGVFGLRKVGKTSLVNQLRRRFISTPTVFIDCQVLSARANPYFHEILQQLQKALSVQGVDDLPAVPATVDSEIFRRQFLTFFERWESSGRPGSFLIIFDEVDKFFPNREIPNSTVILAEYVHCFRVLRGLAQTRQCLVLLVIAYRPEVNRHNLLAPGVGENPMFRSFQEEHLGFLAAADSNALLHDVGLWKEITWDGPARQRVFHYCGGHPLVTRLFASQACEEGVRKMIDVTRVEEVAAEIQATFRRHDIGNYYKEGIWDLLREEEQQVLNAICRNGTDGIPEAELAGERREDALSSLEHFGLVTNADRRLHLTSALFRSWVQRRLSV
ncbi:MAG: hypothetical protein H0U97_15915 [Gammaproteobacteria bacterium]|nr:hypothetical protein [Gammaproteobacteria bacterium]